MDKSAIEAMVDSVSRKPSVLQHPDATPAMLLPIGYSIQSLKDFMKAPDRVRQNVTLLTADDFIAYWARFRHESSVVFGDERSATYLAVIDYHSAAGDPTWCSHTAAYNCPKSDEFRIWSGLDGKGMPQAEFAGFIEDNYIDITRPSHAEMIQVSTNLQAKKSVAFSQATRLDNGETQLTYQEEIKGTVESKGGSLKVPQDFTIKIPIFLNGPEYEIKAKLRYRITEGKLVMWFDLHRPAKVVETATRKISEVIRKGIGASAEDNRMFLGSTK